MSNGHAPKGGTIGVNGERYAGGQFLPSTHRPKGSAKARGTRRMLVEPGVIAEVPAGFLPILGKFAAVSTYDHETRTFELLPVEHPVWGMFGADSAAEYREETARWLDAYRRGERLAPA